MPLCIFSMRGRTERWFNWTREKKLVIKHLALMKWGPVEKRRKGVCAWVRLKCQWKKDRSHKGWEWEKHENRRLSEAVVKDSPLVVVIHTPGSREVMCPECVRLFKSCQTSHCETKTHLSSYSAAKNTPSYITLNPCTGRVLPPLIIIWISVTWLYERNTKAYTRLYSTTFPLLFSPLSFIPCHSYPVSSSFFLMRRSLQQSL